MIFSKLFGKKNKWQSEKASDRIIAVSELDASNNNDKTVLHELAFNDSETSVRRAALEKLNDFALFWQASKKDPSTELKKYALKRTKQTIISNDDSQLSEQQKITFIKECKNKQLVVELLPDLTESSLIMAALERVDKERTYFDALNAGRLNAEHAITAANEISDQSLLKRLSKHLSGDAKQSIDDKLATIEAQKHKPQQVEKQAKLILAKLLNLKNIEEFKELESTQEVLIVEWQDLKKDWSFLDAALANEFDGKFEDLQASTEKHLLKLKASFEEEQKQQQAEQAEQAVVAELSQQLDKLADEISAATEAGNTSEAVAENQWNAAFNFLNKAIQEADISESHKAELSKRTASLESSAQQLPKLIENVNNAKAIIAELEKLEAPADFTQLNTVNPVFKKLRAEWKDILNETGGLSSELTAKYQEVTAPLTTAIKALEKEQNFKFSGFKRKQSELDNLIADGRFREAFGLHKKLSFWFAELNESQQRQVDKRWQELEEKINDLKSLQQEIAAPKRQELLDQITQLAEKPLIDPSEQAHRVKVLRNDWNSLGHAADESEQVLLDKFNEMSEKAFQPCRAFYQELEAEREAALKAKQWILEQLNTIATNLDEKQVADWKELESLFNNLTSQWHSIGKVDRQHLAELNASFKKHTFAIKEHIKNYHQDNADAKSKLIDQANKIVEGDSSDFEKADALKGLQSKWKKIGFAGRHIDNKLWHEFRAINNKVFDAVDAQRSEQKQAAQAVFEESANKLQELESALSEANSLNELRDIEDGIKSVDLRDKNMMRGQSDKLKKQMLSLQDKIAAARQNLLNAQHAQQFEDLFGAVVDLINGKKADIASLKPAWQTAINAQSRDDRHTITIQMELVAEQDSPAEDQAKRQSIQMDMMRDKLEGGASLELNDLLEQWLSAGAFSEQDLPLVERVKPLFV